MPFKVIYSPINILTANKSQIATYALNASVYKLSYTILYFYIYIFK